MLFAQITTRSCLRYRLSDTTAKTPIDSKTSFFSIQCNRNLPTLATCPVSFLFCIYFVSTRLSQSFWQSKYQIFDPNNLYCLLPLSVITHKANHKDIMILIIVLSVGFSRVDPTAFQFFELK